MTTTEKDYASRIEFHKELEVMEVDFSHFTFADAATVDAFYDEIERQLNATGCKWYFLVNYEACQLYETAWIAFASRGKRVNLASSLGSVRYAAPAVTQAAIENDSKKQDFEANLFPSREDALGQIAQWRKRAASV